LDHTDKLEPLETKLARMITDNPNITLAELIQITDCTTAEARTARFYADSW
ncbi:ribosome recycling factor family protein, partial [Shewanella sp.]|uniref:ribosome recycling factor family protein n=1 Tax=Shewanella sp. TaxID=50422 RepID=UPI002582CD45